MIKLDVPSSEVIEPKGLTAATVSEWSRKALFPISVDNPGFGTEFTVGALSAIKETYDEIVFFVADELQVYNKVSRAKNGEELTHALALFAEKNVYFAERKQWLGKLKTSLPKNVRAATWTFAHISTFIDRRFYNILRNVTIAFETIPLFQNDIKTAAEQYCIRTKGEFSAIEKRLSELYIIEEIAVNIRMRVVEQIEAEYYPFKYPKPLRRIYTGDYGISVFALAGMPERNFEFIFYDFSSTPPRPAWNKNTLSIP